MPVQVWYPLINGLQEKALEDVQCQAVQIIKGANSTSYPANLSSLGLEKLSDRRSSLTKDFALSLYRDPHHRWWFAPSPPHLRTSKIKLPRFQAPPTRNPTGEKSPLHKYTEILNQISDKEIARSKATHTSLDRN